MYLNRKNRLATMVCLIALVFTGVFAAIPARPAQAAVRTVTLTIDNRTTSPMSLRLEGDSNYYLTVADKTTQSYTINRGSYDYTLKGCGMTTKGELELKSDTIMINPVCGGNVRAVPKDKSKINLGALLKVVPVTITSELDYQTLVTMMGPSTYVFTPKPDQDLKVTIGKGVYTVRYYACGVNIKQTFQAYKGATLYLRCP